jgi:RNA polymerase sigma-70 factor (ECF subfamily)
MVSTPEPLTPAEFADAFQSVSRSLWGLAAAILGGRSHAEDVVQEAATTALSRLESFQRGSSFTAWMGQIVRFTALNRARRVGRTRERGGEEWVQGAIAAATRAPGPVDGRGELREDQQEFDDAVLRALNQLGTMARASFLLRVVLELSYAEISILLGIPEGTAMSHVHRSRTTLRGLLEADATFEFPALWRAS